MDLADLFSDSVDVPPPPDEFDVKQLPAHGGAWLLTDEAGRPIQLGGCEGVRRSIAFRFSAPDDDEKRRTRADVRTITRQIWWWPTHSQFETAYDYHRIVRQLYPDDYRTRLAFGASWYVRVDLKARIPHLTPTRKVFASKVTYFGPFTSRASCTRYVDVLEELFGLCRHMDQLEKAPHGRRCAYYDIGKCPAPCEGLVSLDDHRGRVARAIAFVRGGPSEMTAESEIEMAQAARAREYERAAAAKHRIEQARKVVAGLYRFVAPTDAFNWLIVQRGPGRSRVKPFFVRGGWIDRGETVELKNLAEHVPGWIEAMGHDSPSSLGDDAAQRAEHAWLVAHFLFRSAKLPGLFLQADDLPDAEALGERVRESFAVRTRPSKARDQTEPEAEMTTGGVPPEADGAETGSAPDARRPDAPA